MLVKELTRLGDRLITVVLNNKEYIIDSIGHVTAYSDVNSSYLCLNIRDGGSGNIKR